MSKVFNRDELVKMCEKQGISSFKDLNEFTIPDGFTEIGKYAFMDCRFLKKVDIPNSITYIGKEAFRSCNSLEEIIIPDSVTEIGESSFLWCDSLKEIEIPDSVTEIDDYAFYGCKSLKNITIHNGAAEISCNAFENCPSIEKIISNDDVFNQIKNYLPADCVHIDSKEGNKNNNHRMTYNEFVEYNNRNKQYIKEKGLITFHIEDPRNACKSGVITAVKHGVAVVDNPEALEQNWDDMILLLDNSENTEKKSKRNGKLTFDEQVFPEISSEDIKKLESLKDSGYDKSAVEEHMMFDETIENENDRGLLD